MSDRQLRVSHSGTPLKTPRDKVVQSYVSGVSPRHSLTKSRVEHGLQIIDGDGNFASSDTRERVSLAHYLASKPEFARLGMEFNAVGILGAQSSGKSTLLNHLFGTEFTVLNEALGRSRTTHGVWMALTGKRSNVVVFDLEGTDGSAREDDYSFERKTSLFSLSVCSVLMVNLWSHDVGRFQASNMSLLKTVFELNLQLFAREESPLTLIVFVIRDREADFPFDQIERTVREDISRIWDTVIPPEQFADASINQFFDFEFTSLPHYEHDHEQFLREVAELKKRFDVSSDDTFFQPQYKKEIPADGLACFCEQIWDTIRSNKDLDLPSQREMLSKYRCSEIADQVQREFEDDIKAQRKELKRGQQVAAFAATFSAAIGAAEAKYKDATVRYLDTIVEAVAEDLRKRLQTVTEALFDRQLTLMRTAFLARAEREFTNIRNQYVLLESAKEFVPAKYQKHSREIRRTRTVLEKSWDAAFVEAVPKFLAERVASKSTDLLAEIQLAAESTITHLVQFMQEHFLLYIRTALKPNIVPYLDACRRDMWTSVRDVVHGVFTDAFQRLEEGFRTCSSMPRDEIAAVVQKNREVLLRFVQSVFESYKCEFGSILENAFKQRFTLDKNGLPKKWTQQDDVDALYFAAKDATEELMDMLCYFRITPDDDGFRFILSDPTTDDDVSCVSVDALPDGAVAEKVLLNADERRALIAEMNEVFHRNYLLAVREKESSEVKYQIPMYLIVLLCVFGADEAWTLLTNPLLLFVVLIVAGVLFVGYKMNLGGVATQFVNQLLTFSVSTCVETLRGSQAFGPIVEHFVPKSDV